MWRNSQLFHKNNDRYSKLLFLLGFLTIAFFSSGKILAQDKVFTVVIDPGHGGKDSGTTGTARYKDKNEKDIVLGISLKIEKLMKKEMPQTKLIFTRKKDVFIPLKKRGEIANKAKADLFISIHANAASYKASGTETYVLGVHRNETNLNVAKRENDVILLEEDYEKHYSYDPKSPASIIGLVLMQEDYLEMSKRMAHILENSFSEIGKRRTRGVKQAGFVVLHQTFMPSVLIEVGFLSNNKEEDFLRSNKGQTKIAKSIVAGIKKYKEELDKNKVVNNKKVPKEEKTPAKTSPDKPDIFKGIIFKVQIASSYKKVKTKAKNFKGLKNIEAVKVGKYYKYYLGKTADYTQIKALKKQAKEKGYDTAFVVAFKGKERLSLNQLIKSKQK